jgi:ferredoxin
LDALRIKGLGIINFITRKGVVMPKLTVDGKTADVAAGKRLVLAIEGTGVKIGHRCGGNARCTTCRVEFEAGEPTAMTRAEKEKLEERGLSGQVRLSCQILLTQDMSVRPVLTLDNNPDWDDTGPPPNEDITPDPEWL